jgi:hypothetical protein
VWRSFDVELETRLGERSTYVDGLSFGQEKAALRPIGSDRYADAEVIDEPSDGVRFNDGAVRPGERAVIRLIVTDNTPKLEFYLAQIRPKPISRGPAPGPFAAATPADCALVPWSPPRQNGAEVCRECDTPVVPRGGCGAGEPLHEAAGALNNNRR